MIKTYSPAGRLIAAGPCYQSLMAPDDLTTRAAEAWLADDPDPVEPRRAARAARRAARHRRRAGRPVRRPAHLRHRRAARPAPRRPERDEPRGGHPGRGRPGRPGSPRRAAPGPLVIGYDARHGSREFAEQTARVATGAGREALLLPGPLPTPVLAYAVRALDAVAGVMVTASHNPPQDNGYKVYLGRAAGRAGRRRRADRAAGRRRHRGRHPGGRAARRGPAGRAGHAPRRQDRPGVRAERRRRARPGRPARPGGRVHPDARGRRRRRWPPRSPRPVSPAPAVVAEQAEPDPDFPTVAFPNPEEPGAMDRLLALAAATGADLAIANDPDADRCARGRSRRRTAAGGRCAATSWACCSPTT